MPIQENSKFLKTIFWGSSLGLGLVGVFVLTGYLIVDRSIHIQEVTSSVINSAGQRRWLSQRIALEALHIASSDNQAEKKYLSGRLAEHCDDLENVHNWLINGEHPFGLKGGMSQDLRKIYFDAPNNVDRELREYIANARTLINWQGEKLSHDNFHLTYILNNAEGHILSELDNVVRMYQTEGEAMVAGQRYLMKVTLFLTLTALFMVALFIFWPMAKHINKEAMALEAARRNAEDSTKLKDKFVSLVAHDLRSPFISMLGLLKMVEENGDGAKLSEKQRLILGRVEQSGEGLLKMIDELLNITRLQTGNILIRPRFIEAAFIVSSVVNSLEHMAKSKKIEISNEVPKGTRLYADFDLIQEVFMNLVSNAIKFTNPGGKIVVFVPEGKKGIAIRDTGVGMNDSYISRIFKYEEKTTTTGTGGEKGSGFGLPLSAEIMLAHGGSLRAESKPGEGTVFYAELPEKKPLALVVDDMDINRAVFTNVLEKARMEVVCAENGAKALRAIEERRPDIIVTDIHMPKMNGFDFLHYIQRDPILKNTPILVISADPDNEIRQKAFMVGASDFMLHPFAPEEFLARARRLIDCVKN
ncbi:MAG: response regulator [Nitrospinae bacterium]|nr:response regulator [Nitrospinota bacterium]